MPIVLIHRLSLTGMGGLAVLSATHWMRDNIADPAPVLAFALGVLPNLSAAFAMPLIIASFAPRLSRASTREEANRAYMEIFLFTTLGLCGWEFFQTTSDRFVFDLNDLLATGLGSFFAYLAFKWHANRSQVENQPAAEQSSTGPSF